MAKTHPSKSELSNFALGKLPTEACSQVASHIDDCTDCQETIRGLDSVSDSLVNGLRSTPPAAEKDPELQRVVEKAASLPSSSSPGAKSPASPSTASSTPRSVAVSLDQFNRAIVECG